MILLYTLRGGRRPCLCLCLVVARSCLRGGVWLCSRFLVWRVLALVPSWQGVAECRTRAECGKAEKVGAVAGGQTVASREHVKTPI